MNTPRHTATHTQLRQWAGLLVSLEQELHRAGMHITARAVNLAVRAIGWEFAGETSQACESANLRDDP